ncbi:hypothetical protein H6C13_13955 [Pseudoflavonifractor phocaeensis]|nr:hypothetical protein [Pseudoflavonifractor phocaeensis]
MVNGLSAIYPGSILNAANFKMPEKLSDGTCLQDTSSQQQPAGQAARYDTLELTPDQCQATLDVSNGITMEVPRAWTIVSETFKSFDAHLQWSLNEADSLNLSFGDRLTFLKEEGQKWVEDKRQNDPEMFATWLKLHKDYIQRGEGDLVGLPSDFTMEDYYSYVKEPFSVLA